MAGPDLTLTTAMLVVLLTGWVSPSPRSTVMVVWDRWAVRVWRANAGPRPIRCPATEMTPGRSARRWTVPVSGWAAVSDGGVDRGPSEGSSVQRDGLLGGQLLQGSG